MTVNSVSSAWNPILIPTADQQWSTFLQQSGSAVILEGSDSVSSSGIVGPVGSGASSENQTDLISASGTVGSQATSWRLQNGFWLPQNRQMRVITQRPNADVNAAHLWAHPDMPYDHAILINGGAPPFYAELQEAPSWMSDIQFLTVVGNELRPGGLYLRLYGANPSSASQPTEGWLVRYRVYGQDFGRGTSPTNYEEVSFRVRVDPLKFLFIATNGNNLNSGTISSPKRDFDGWYQRDVNANTHFGKIVVFRQGTFSVIGQTSNNICRIDPTTKPRSFIGYSGEVVNWDFSSGAFTFWDGVGDVLIQNIHTQGSYLTEIPSGNVIDNARNFAFYGGAAQARVYFDRCEAHDVQPGSAGNDNAGWVWRPNSTPVRNSDFGFTQCHSADVGPGTSNLALVSLSNTDYVTFNNMTAINSSGYKWCSAKSSGRYFSYQWCNLWDINNGTFSDNDGPMFVEVGNAYDSTIPPVGMEYWYSRVNSSGSDVWGTHADSITGNGTIDYNYCSIRGTGFFYGLNQLTTTARRCVIAGSVAQFNGTMTFFECTQGAFSSDYFDLANGNLAGSAASLFGTRGAQIANQLE